MAPPDCQDSAVDWEEIFQVLGNEYRRRLLMNLLEHNPQEDTVPVPESVHQGEKKLTTLQTEMVHRHLPRLEDQGYIEWDQTRHQVVKGRRFDEIRPLLTVLKESEDELPDGVL